MFAVTNSGKEWKCIFIHDKCKWNLNLWRLLFSEKWVSKKKSSARYERTDSRSGKQMFSENNTYQFLRYSYKFMLLSLFNHVWGLPWCFSVTVHILVHPNKQDETRKGIFLTRECSWMKESFKRYFREWCRLWKGYGHKMNEKKVVETTWRLAWQNREWRPLNTGKWDRWKRIRKWLII